MATNDYLQLKVAMVTPVFKKGKVIIDASGATLMASNGDGLHQSE